MPIELSREYKPNYLLRSGHINTIYPFLFRNKPNLPFQRERYITEDNDFFDVDWLHNNSEKLVVLLHGLEGSSNSQYILGTSALFMHQNWSVAAVNWRSCSGEMNNQPTMYHSGFTRDLALLINKIPTKYSKIAIIGFSLGGNVTTKYIIETSSDRDTRIKVAIGVSVPCDLKGSSYMIKKFQNHLYEKKFLDTLLKKMAVKSIQFPDIVQQPNINKTKTLWDFDDYFTAPLHGFVNALDYYNKCSTYNKLDKINLPFLMVNALDDSFLAPTCFPFDIAKDHPYFHLSAPKYGGHVGFANFSQKSYWIENTLFEFISRYIIE